MSSSRNKYQVFNVDHTLSQYFCHEAVVWALLDHVNVLPFLGANTKLFSSLCLISPWMANGNVMEYLRSNPKHDRLSALFDIIGGLAYLHGINPPVIHGDIKGANILVDESRRCCLADFGLSSVYESISLATASREPVIGTVPWSAPELSNPDILSPNTTASDIYALGCTMYEILSGRIPFSHIRISTAIIFHVLSGKRPQRPEDNETISDEIWQLIEACWAQESTTRPSATEVGTRLQQLVSYPKSISGESPLQPTRETSHSSLASSPVIDHVETENFSEPMRSLGQLSLLDDGQQVPPSMVFQDLLQESWQENNNLEASVSIFLIS
ncbi:kinase-like protein [Dendrothele bispora CBS 962.96]|uniref:Kinase-like protein n=1 Tax=Dendrothele bispora (strain CBS 962.96) TaxID=1314807 RepID=A0A4S8LMN6_DENBC|nr:kinase-like protein [Dendrothele bispora CBS 962.96]